MQSNQRKTIEQFVILAVIIIAVVAISGCQSYMTTVNLPSGSYKAYPFTYSKGDRLEVTVNSTGEPLNVIILHGGNFSRYTQGEEYFADEYHKGVISTTCDFLVPTDGEYYLILENRGPAVVRVGFSYISHAATRYETTPIEGTLSPTQKEPELIPSSIERLTPTTTIAILTTQPSPVITQPQQPQKPGTSEIQMLYDKGVLLAQQGNLTGALTLFDQALQLDPKNGTIWTEKGYVLFYLGRYEEALIAFERTTTLDPNNAMAWNSKAAALINLERFAEALVAAERATTLDPNNAIAWNSKAAALINLERFAEALVAAERATTLDPNYALAWRNKAATLYRLSRFDEALIAAERATTLNPSDAGMWNLKAITLTKLERYEEALAAAEVATAADPNDADAWNTKGWIQYSLGRYTDAIVSFDRALEIDPEYQLARTNKALALEKLG